jgi:hypothetical protein
MATVESNRALIASFVAARAQLLGQQIISTSSAIYEDGIFWQSNMGDTQHNLKFAALMATLARNAGGDIKADYTRRIVESVERCLETNATPAGLFTGGGIMTDGSYFQGPSYQSMGSLFDPTATIPITTDLAWIIHQLPANSITSARRRRWISVVQANCDHLDAWPGQPITSFYINGNYAAHLCSCYALTATVSQASRTARYWDMYERAYAFMISPNSFNPGRWINYGLTIDVAGTDYNWDDFEAHLSENHGEVPGPAISYDPNYTLYTLDILSRMAVITRDTRIIRLINALSNKIIPKIIDDAGTIEWPPWTLDGRGGSRQNNVTNMATAYLPVQAMIREKQWLNDLLTPAKIFSLWDLPQPNAFGYLESNSYQTALTTSYPAGRMPGGIVAGLANVATIRYCAELTTVSVASA